MRVINLFAVLVWTISIGVGIVHGIEQSELKFEDIMNDPLWAVPFLPKPNFGSINVGLFGGKAGNTQNPNKGKQDKGPQPHSPQDNNKNQVLSNTSSTPSSSSSGISISVTNLLPVSTLTSTTNSSSSQGLSFISSSGSTLIPLTTSSTSTTSTNGAKIIPLSLGPRLASSADTDKAKSSSSQDSRTLSISSTPITASPKVAGSITHPQETKATSVTPSKEAPVTTSAVISTSSISSNPVFAKQIAATKALNTTSGDEKAKSKNPTTKTESLLEQNKTSEDPIQGKQNNIKPSVATTNKTNSSQSETKVADGNKSSITKLDTSAPTSSTPLDSATGKGEKASEIITPKESNETDKNQDTGEDESAETNSSGNSSIADAETTVLSNVSITDDDDDGKDVGEVFSSEKENIKDVTDEETTVSPSDSITDDDNDEKDIDEVFSSEKENIKDIADTLNTTGTKENKDLTAETSNTITSLSGGVNGDKITLFHYVLNDVDTTKTFEVTDVTSLKSSLRSSILAIGANRNMIANAEFMESGGSNPLKSREDIIKSAFLHIGIFFLFSFILYTNLV
ncbi:hypothetical protein H4219_003720 [Mycoemilia scoparia]|uniref:Uncharacterized protein n=1 Tax=Mycoemilia scoparia TaxID=417184 RepID=A0A9W8DS94_9FUNG|nr:hypothetical protein H4219_003720 [Mycoemilia scoparia]